MTPIKDYLLAIVAREQKEALLEIIHVPTLAAQLAAKVNEVFVPENSNYRKKLTARVESIERNGLSQAIALRMHYYHTPITATTI